ncbi:MAG: hypothetical protein KAT94_03895 [Candidatus Aenigmarchaeota archaeon]|nr:hypothetical protein [Candidatus Aenigmarchaeota archaeon]
MNARERMKKTLRTMIRSADKGYIEPVFRLNDYYEKLVPEVYSEPRTQEDLDFDNCRQSAFFAAKYLKEGDTEMYKKFLSDAKERFPKLPEPED